MFGIMAIIEYIGIQRFSMGINIRLKVARVEKGLSQQGPADRVQATRQTIGLIEKGDFNPSLGLCIRIAKALGKTLDQLFWEEEKMKIQGCESMNARRQQRGKYVPGCIF
jgi:putative transcriptional regulator